MPQRRSIVSSSPSIRGPLGTKVASSIRSRVRPGMTTTPDGAVQSPMIILKMMLVAQTHHAQRTGDGSFAGSQNSPEEKNVRTAPDTLGKQRTKRKQDECQLGRNGGNKTLYKASVI